LEDLYLSDLDSEYMRLKTNEFCVGLYNVNILKKML